MLQGSASEVLQDREVQEQSRLFVANVVGDDVLQREGGTALWRSVLYALQPGLIRMTGICMLGASIALLRICVSPF